jgi:hypothetical protein
MNLRQTIIDWLTPKVTTSNTSGQTRDSFSTIFNFSQYEPLKFNLELYDLLREAIPVLDVAVVKLTGLIGDFEIKSDNQKIVDTLTEFKDNVRVNDFQYGLNPYISQMADSAIVKGFAVGELVYNQGVNDIQKLKTTRANDFRFTKEGDRIVLGQIQADGQFKKFLEDEDIYYLAFDCREGHPQGYSLFYSLPFVGDIFIRIEQSIRNTIWRVGDPSFIITVAGGTQAGANQAAAALKTEVSEVFKSRKVGNVRDISVGVGENVKVDVRALGTEKDLINLEIPIHTALEQIVARTGFPPFMFGLYKWQTTERMATHQNDMIVSNIESYRKMMEPMLFDIMEKKLIVSKLAGEFTIEWNPVNLMDEKEIAEAGKLQAEARQIEYDRIAKMFLDGFLDEQGVVSELLEHNLITQKQASGNIVELINRNLKLARSREMLKSIFEGY